MSLTRSTDSVIRRVCYYSGRVQGVGFRYTVKNVMLPLAVRGFVRNLPDGRVEVMMEGTEQEANEAMERIRQKMEGFIKRVQRDEGPPTGEFQDFSIRH